MGRAARVGVGIALSLGVSGPALADPPVRLAAVGDLAFVGPVREGVARGTHDPFSAVRGVLSRADFTLGNLESVLSPRRAPAWGRTERHGVILRGPCEAGRALSRAGFDLVTVANNHAYDLGGEGVRDTAACVRDAGVAVVGLADSRARARAPYLTVVGGLRVGVLAFTFETNRRARGAARVATLDDDPVGAVRALRPSVDAVVVTLHWGVEFTHDPTREQVRLAHALVDAGADAVIGHHPHVLQAVELYHGRPVAYSLGNFVFGPQPAPRSYAAVLELTLQRARPGGVAVTAVTLLPVRLTGREGTPTPATGPEGDPVRAVLVRASRPFGAAWTTRGGALELTLARGARP